MMDAPVPTIVDTARRVLPAASFGNLAGDIIIREGHGGRVTDIDGNEYVDFLLGSGPMFAGHGHPDVVAAVQEQLARGFTFFANNEYGIRLAAELVDAVACAEQVRFVSSGTEADAFAMRVARAYRGRDKILKFEGGFHGMGDHSLMSWTPKRLGNFPQAEPSSAGICRSVADDMLIAPFNDADLAAALIHEHRDELAGVIVEPFQRLLPPKPGFLQALRKATKDAGVLLIFDEIVTGFRFAWGGAQEYYGVVPDLCTLGKIIGGGFPLAAIAGPAEIMALFDRAKAGEDRFLPQVGTLSGNPMAAVAGLATLQVLKQPGVYDKVFATGRTLMEALAGLLRETGLPGQVIGVPPLFDVIFATGDVADYRATLRADAAMTGRFNRLLRERGVFKGDSKMYMSVAHDARDVAQAIDAFGYALRAEAGR
ncbi:MAG TPA: aminotransferase class III-fold pyridoxal phosphate-dependent enzyme [Acetobacteraceae bacterium]|nr:aminotransferase class III-fold pyridoxal phosphate-dependent enzyme [Acetobacteraceae bacterium]